MASIFKVGDRVRGELDDISYEGKIVSISPNQAYVLKDSGTMWACKVFPDGKIATADGMWDNEHYLELITPTMPEKNMYLNQLTEGQKTGLSVDDQALFELGIINANLTLSNTTYVIDFLFKQNKVAIAKQAAKDVADEKKRLKELSK